MYTGKWYKYRYKYVYIYITLTYKYAYILYTVVYKYKKWKNWIKLGVVPARKLLYVHNWVDKFSTQTWIIFEEFDSKIFNHISKWQ